MTISIFKFLAEYYGVTVDAGRKCTHMAAKKTFQFLKGCPFGYAKANPELVGSGEIIYVKDTTGQTLPYICPKVTKTNDMECEYTRIERVRISIDKKKIFDHIDEVPTRILRELLSRYKDKPEFYWIIKRELIRRGVYETKKYKLRKETLELEEGERNDKYQRRREIKYKKS